MKINPKVSACVITFNQENFIGQCIEGCLSQKLTYNYEILIGNDNSTDKTNLICAEYESKYSDIIKLKNRIENLGMIGNWIATILECSGDYIALCEGDDFWSNPYKLQKQVDFLEANPEYVACFHSVDILEPNGELKEDYITILPLSHETIDDLASKGNYIHTPSVVFRNVLKAFPEEILKSPLADYFIYMLLSEKGKLKFFSDKMAVYRNGVGIFSQENKSIRSKRTKITFFLLWKYFAKKNSHIANVLFNRFYFFEKESRDVGHELYNEINQYLIHKEDFILFFDAVINLNESNAKVNKQVGLNEYLREVKIFTLIKLILYKLGMVKLRDKLLRK